MTEEPAELVLHDAIFSVLSRSLGLFNLICPANDEHLKSENAARRWIGDLQVQAWGVGRRAKEASPLLETPDNAVVALDAIGTYASGFEEYAKRPQDVTQNGDAEQEWASITDRKHFDQCAANVSTLYLMIGELRNRCPFINVPPDRATSAATWEDHRQQMESVELWAFRARWGWFSAAEHHEAAVELRELHDRYWKSLPTARFLKGAIEYFQSGSLATIQKHVTGSPPPAIPEAPWQLKNIATSVHRFFQDARTLDLVDAPDPPGTDSMGSRAADALLEKLRKALIRRMDADRAPEAANGHVPEPVAAPAEAADAFPPMEFVDPFSRARFGFSRSLLWQLWKELWSARRRLEIADLEQLPAWRDKVIEGGTVQTALSDLRRFWRDNGRVDFAECIKSKASTFYLEPNPRISH